MNHQEKAKLAFREMCQTAFHLHGIQYKDEEFSAFKIGFFAGIRERMNEENQRSEYSGNKISV